MINTRIGAPASTSGRVCCESRLLAAAPTLKAQRFGHRSSQLLRCRAKQEADDDVDDGNISPAAARSLDQLQRIHHQKKLGSEYGEGFMQFRPGGEPVRLDVDTLNERLKHQGARRLRMAHRPDEAFGIIFNFDGLVADTRGAYAASWDRLAAAKGVRPLSPHQRHMLLGGGAVNTCPERIMMDVLGWTRDLRLARSLSYELAECYATELGALQEPMPGLREWLGSLANFGVPCALTSALDRATVRRLLERWTLHDHFTTMVTAEDDMETIAQRYLSAALSMQRPPNLCVVFDTCPEGVTAAHNCTMKSVAVCSPWYPAYRLKAADVTVGSLGDLTVYNIRRLFAQQGDEFMDLRKKFSSDQGGTSGRRRTAAGTLDPEDEGGGSGI